MNKVIKGKPYSISPARAQFNVEYYEEPFKSALSNLQF